MGLRCGAAQGSASATGAGGGRGCRIVLAYGTWALGAISARASTAVLTRTHRVLRAVLPVKAKAKGCHGYHLLREGQLLLEIRVQQREARRHLCVGCACMRVCACVCACFCAAQGMRTVSSFNVNETFTCTCVRACVCVRVCVHACATTVIGTHCLGAVLLTRTARAPARTHTAPAGGLPTQQRRTQRCAGGAQTRGITGY